MHVGLGEFLVDRTPSSIAGHDMYFMTRFGQRARDFLDADVPRIVGIPDFANPHRAGQVTTVFVQGKRPREDY